MRIDGYEDYDGEKVEFENFANARGKRRAAERALKKFLKKNGKQSFQD